MREDLDIPVDFKRQPSAGFSGQILNSMQVLSNDP